MSPQLDLITIGRVSVDLYGQQIGGRLEDVSSFLKGVGGCPANIAIGAARLGLRSALISRVGNEAMGRFILEQLAREGVDTRGVRTDPQRLTALVLLGVRDPESFPLIFYRENCADSALTVEDIDEGFVASARALLVTGTHFSIAEAAQAQREAMRIARAAGRQVVLDIDYRPNLWGIGGHGAGESRYAASEQVTRTLQGVLPQCDLIVGTEEELRIAGGAEELLTALGRIRELSAGIIVCKRGAQGCIVFSGPIPQRLEDGLVAGGMDVTVYNVLGAGDAFLAGFLRGYLRGESLSSCARLGNACGAIAVSRLLCSSEFATWPELDHYLTAGSERRALRTDDALNHLHWVTTRGPAPQRLFTLAVDPTALERPGSGGLRATTRSAQLAALLVEAMERAGAGREGFGVVLDAGGAGPAQQRASSSSLWIAQRVEMPGSRPLEFYGSPSLATDLGEWPSRMAAHCRCLYHPDDPEPLRLAQERELLRLAACCRAQRRELLLEIVAGQSGKLKEDTASQVLRRLYGIGVRPDWWQLEPQPSAAAWSGCAAVIRAADPYCLGIVVGSLQPPAGIHAALRVAAGQAMVRGFAAGHTMFTSTVADWLSGRTSVEAAVNEMTEGVQALVEVWMAARDPQTEGERA